MQRERCGEDPLEEDDDGDASRRAKTDEGDDFYACDLGVRYPTLQVASHREDLHVRIKVTLFSLVHLLCPLLSTDRPLSVYF